MIDTKALREKILDLAMRGKLVPQDPNDEPASELLKRIKAEKEELIKQKKIKRDKNETEIFRGDDGLHYEKFTDGTVKEIEVPYELPVGWEWARIASATKNITAGGDKPKEVSSEKTNDFQIPIYSNGIKDNGLYGWAKEAKVFEPSVTVSARGTIGFTAIRNHPFVPIVRLISVTPLEKTVDVSFLKYMLSHLIPTGEGTSIPQLTVPGLKPFLIALPPYHEQLKIVQSIKSYLKLIDEIDNNQLELNNITVQLKQKVLDVAMQGKLVPQDPNDEPASVLLEKIRAEKLKLFEEGKLKKKDLVETEIVKGDDNAYYEKLPDSWNCVTLSSIVDYRMGKTPDTKNEAYWIGPGFPWVSIADMGKNRYVTSTSRTVTEKALSEVFNHIVSPKGTLIMSFKLSIGKVGLLNQDSVHNEAIISIFPYLNDDYSLRDYLFCILPVVSNSGETVSAIKGKTLNSKKIDALPIPLPPVREQREISQTINKLYRILEVFS
ncbi:restriction endonuclease subunit S [Enterococcus faecalis]|uniref:restriction endonuclease subunit S n=4 Tax=Enterococcus faecalis TaxID=1351 RepID=UPI000DEB4FDE|nr:restriction endonuclease subunit S [Enterococcus faecalis]EGO5041655.1 restriction endonuclease subunit S [Enterococcus faecalis]EGO8419398.1 restriction endonuclease subunit S [Enterococcus faecalis]EHF1120413.1 restriction endonuclease subunit S [Enterococcus faecalis]EIM5426181.1 restriction endonuclease subunit S [Enterococcus faecalis]EIP8244353.1 restriction endonuclease subunit S [Enterococcus faecalis]